MERHARRKFKGQTLVIVALLFGMGVMIGLVALAFDGGSALLQRRNMQNSADAASLGAAKLLNASIVINDGIPTYEVTNQSIADDVAQFLQSNRGGTTSDPTYTGQFEYGTFDSGSYVYQLVATFNTTYNNGSWTFIYPYTATDLVPPSTSAVRVTTNIADPTTFARAININTIPVSAKAAAALQGDNSYIPQGPTWPMTRQYQDEYEPNRGICKPVLFWSNSSGSGSFKSLVQLGAKQGASYQDSSRHAQLLTQPDPVWSKPDLATSPSNQSACGFLQWSPKGNCSNPLGLQGSYGDTCCTSGNNAKVDITNWIQYSFFGTISTQSRAWRDLNDPPDQLPTHDWRSDDAKARDVAGDWLEVYSGNFGNVVLSSIQAYIAQNGTYGDDPQSIRDAYGHHVDKVMYLWQDAETWDYPAGCNPGDTCHVKKWLPTTDPHNYMRVRMMKAIVFRFYENLAVSGGGTIAPPSGFSCPAGSGVNSTGSEIYGVFVGEEIPNPPPPGPHGLYNFIGPIDP